MFGGDEEKEGSVGGRNRVWFFEFFWGFEVRIVNFRFFLGIEFDFCVWFERNKEVT